MDIDGNDSGSETGSAHSMNRSVRSYTGAKKPTNIANSTTSTNIVKETKDDRPVSKLRPKKPLILSGNNTILEVAEAMASERTDAAILTGQNGNLKGIITDNDLTRRVIAVSIDPSSSEVNKVMTKNPKCVKSNDSAIEALGLMVENHFRHLPVTDENGVIVGLLDIAKCLYDAISKLDKLEKSEGNKDTAVIAAQAIVAASLNTGGNTKQMAAMQKMLGPLVQQMFGQTVPTLGKILESKRPVIVKSSLNIRETSIVMAESKSAVLVVEDDELVGIFTPKDMLNRVIAKGLSPDLTAVSSVMTQNPDTVSPEMTLLDALHQMHEYRYLHLPVVNKMNGEIIGLVDVMELIVAAMGESKKLIIKN